MLAGVAVALVVKLVGEAEFELVVLFEADVEGLGLADGVAVGLVVVFVLVDELSCLVAAQRKNAKIMAIIASNGIKFRRPPVSFGINVFLVIYRDIIAFFKC